MRAEPARKLEGPPLWWRDARPVLHLWSHGAVVLEEGRREGRAQCCCLRSAYARAEVRPVAVAAQKSSVTLARAVPT